MIVVSTPTGQIGGQTLARVLDGGAPVRVIVRDPARLDARVRERAEVVQGSADDVELVVKACAGAESLLWVVPPNPRAPSVAEHVLDFVRPLCAAITRQGVRRVVGVSSLGRGAARHAGQISAIFAMDALVESTGVHYRALCPPGFMDNLLWQAEPIRRHGVFFSSLSADRTVPICATRDIAAAAARLLLDPAWTGQEAVPVLGPEDLSQNDQAEIMSEVLGRPVRFQRISPEEHRAALVEQGMSPAWAQGIVDMASAVDRGIYATGPDAPRSGTTFRQWCADVLKPVVG